MENLKHTVRLVGIVAREQYTLVLLTHQVTERRSLNGREIVGFLTLDFQYQTKSGFDFGHQLEDLFI